MSYVWQMILTMAAVCLVLRFLPFLIFRDEEHIPAFVIRLGRYLPIAAMGMLVVYCLKDADITSANHGLPEYLGVLVTAGIHLWKKNTILSILIGTAVCVGLYALLG